MIKTVPLTFDVALYVRARFWSLYFIDFLFHFHNVFLYSFWAHI